MEVVSRGWYKRARHLSFFNTVLLCLEQRQAPAGLLRILGRSIPDSVGDDELVPFHKLMVFMPPRHSKSETGSRGFSGWYLGKHPDHHVIVTSYGQEKAMDFGRACRDDLKEFGPSVFGIGVRQDDKAAHRWHIEGDRGGMYAAGVRGGITGRGADLFIYDDLVKDAQEAWSATLQEANANWLESTANTRLAPDAIELYMTTRWHAKDPAGYLLDASKGTDADAEEDPREAWAVIVFPAIAEEGDQLGREPGEALWPERFPLERMKARRARMVRTEIGAYYWQAMYQQQPALPEGLLYFDKRIAEYGRDHAPQPRERVETSPVPGTPADGYVLIWQRPINGEFYYIGADTADGKGEVVGTLGSTGGPDRNYAAIYRLRDDVQVAAIYGRQTEQDYAKLLYQYGRWYNDATLAVETNRKAVISALMMIQPFYPALYVAEPIGNVKVVRKPELVRRRLEYGFNTNVTTRPQLLSEFREAVHSGVLKIMDKATWLELLTFVQGDPPAAMPGQHDDRVMGSAIAWQARKQARRRPAGRGPRHIGGSINM